MATKPILEIEVKDEQFQAFRSKFAEFTSALQDAKKNAGEMIKSLGKSGDSTLGSSFIDLNSKMGSIAVASERVHKAWSKTLHAVKAVTLTLGAMAGGGFLGSGLLAYSAVSRWRTATGMGASPGEMGALDAYYSPYVDSRKMLSTAADMRQSLKGRALLSRFGMGQAQIDGEDNFQLAQDIAEHLRSAWKNSPQNEEYARSMGMLDFFSMPELRNLASASDQDMQDARRGSTASVGPLGFSRETERQWQSLSVQLQKAGIEIDSVLIRGLHGLADPLARLSASIVKALETVLGNPNMGHWLDEFGKGIEHVADIIGSPDTQQKISDFIGGLAAMVSGIGTFVSWLTGVHGSSTPGVAAQSAIFSDVAPAPGSPEDQNRRDYLTSLEKQNNLPAGSLYAMYGTESSFGRNLGPSSAGAIGPFQIMPGNFQAAHIDPWNFEQSANWEAQQMATLMKRYGGDFDKALAANDWKLPKLDADIATYKDQWTDHLPNETTGYLGRVHEYMNYYKPPPDARPKVTVNVNNSTASRVEVQAVQVAH